MLKRCKVLLNNDAVTVIDFDGKKVQLPAIKRKAIEVNVVFENGRYSVVDDNYVFATKTKFAKKKIQKKIVGDDKAVEPVIENESEKSEEACDLITNDINTEFTVDTEVASL